MLPSRYPTLSVRLPSPSAQAVCEYDVSQSPDQIAAAIVATLNQTAPGLSLATGTPERQLVDACATQISAAMISQYLTGGMLDINTKTGLELDQFVGIFGFGRLQGAASSGIVTM